MAVVSLERLPRESDAFAEHGYAVLLGFVEPALVAALRREIELALEGPPTPGCERAHNRLVPLRWSHSAVDLILESRARRHAVATAIGAEDLRWISGYVSVKEPRTPPLAWHQDWWCWDHPVSLRPSAAQVALLVYLTDTSERSGALRVLPRSHLTSVPLHAALRGVDPLVALSLDHPALGDQPGQVTIVASAGDAVVLDYRLLHGTHANAAVERRDCLMLSFTPSWRGLPDDIRAHLIQHPAQPNDGEPPPASSWTAELLPDFAGVRADLELNRVAPGRFTVG